MGRVKDYSEFFTGIDLKPAVLLNNFNVRSTLFHSLKIDSFRCKSNDDGRKSPCLLLDIKQDLKLSLFAPSSLPRCYSFQLCWCLSEPSILRNFDKLGTLPSKIPERVWFAPLDLQLWDSFRSPSHPLRCRRAGQVQRHPYRFDKPSFP